MPRLITMSLNCLIPNVIWFAQQSLSFGPVVISTRMTVVQLHDGALWVHSPIMPTASLVEELAAIGEVRYVIAPNKSHHLYFLPFIAAFPTAHGYVANGLTDKRPDLNVFPLIPADAPWNTELRNYAIQGLPIINETVWFHPLTGTLILTDLLFSFSKSDRGLRGLITSLLGVRGKLGMSRTMKFAVKDKEALAMSIAPLLTLPVQRIILAHEQIIEEDAAAKLAAAFEWLQ